MRTIPVQRWIANAAARFSGLYGAISTQARKAQCSRQAIYDQARNVQSTLKEEHSGGPRRKQLAQDNQVLRQDNVQLWDWVAQSVEFPPAQQQKFAATALAMGLSVTQTRVLLALILGPEAAPSRTTIHRWVQAAGEAAGKLLKRLDASCKSLILTGCLDEIFFHRRAVLVGIEPASMVWFLGIKSQALRGRDWAEQLQAWNHLGYVVADAGVALQAGITQSQRQRRRQGQSPLDSGLDVFHTQHEAQAALAISWNQVERCWKAYDLARHDVRRAQRKGVDARRANGNAQGGWVAVLKSFERYEAARSAWKNAETALQVFRPDGQLNHRAWAEAQMAAAIPALVGRAWGRVRNHLRPSETFTFLDRLHRELGQLPISDPLREAWCGSGGCVDSGPENRRKELSPEPAT